MVNANLRLFSVVTAVSSTLLFSTFTEGDLGVVAAGVSFVSVGVVSEGVVSLGSVSTRAVAEGIGVSSNRMRRERNALEMHVYIRKMVFVFIRF